MSQKEYSSETSTNAPVLLSKKEYDYLRARAEKLDKLEAAGVDNWDGYDYAFEDEDNEEEDDE